MLHIQLSYLLTSLPWFAVLPVPPPPFRTSDVIQVSYYDLAPFSMMFHSAINNILFSVSGADAQPTSLPGK